ncbi:MAG: hypothetical protein ACD_84C00019G0001, partial [uncultured bacterium]
IHVGKFNYTPLKIISIDGLQDFEDNYADETIVTLALSGGMYAKDIYPFKDQVDITILRVNINEVTGTVNTALPVQSERYTATLIDTGNPIIEGNGSNTATKESLDLTTITEVSFQLVNKSLEQMRMISVGGIYRNTPAVEVIRCVMTNEMRKVVVDGKRLPIGVDIIEGFNSTKRDHVIIPQGTKLVKLPEYIHQNCGGIYSSGFGYYLYNDHWYIYPCYDSTRFNKVQKTLTVINVPRNKFTGIEKTFRVDGKTTVILATGEVRYADNTEVQQLNFGNGLRFAAADNFMKNFSSTTGNKTTVNRGSNNVEVVSSQRVSGNNNVHMSSNSINSNAFAEYSKLAKSQGNLLSFVWENSLPSIITPGLPVKILYLDGDRVKEIYGVVLKAHHYTQTKRPGMTDKHYFTNSAISVFVK